ncbi:hypothetical protein [Desulfofustis limnaeus]|jgi:hypothetical protein|uniref:Uncharacterized protein n=1 Tax=Desulfofustis limnaeus TaxID=2740163 RepID=A0ABM7W8Y8_9BACT|nr:hypothetical protein [Desulfofustis limnaeus]MDX9895727.1 hypothetical protein [Desulfofustis sp.]BDD87447.1 hypothetical protein DPPLL_18120 [Desulfofustis limnaeus]
MTAGQERPVGQPYGDGDGDEEQQEQRVEAMSVAGFCAGNSKKYAHPG